MGAVIDLPDACAPFSLEVRRESVYLSDGAALIATRGGTDPIGPHGSALRATSTSYGAAGGFAVRREHLPALAGTIEHALAHPSVIESLRAREREAGAVAELGDEELVVTAEVLPVYGHADGSALDGPLDRGPCSTVEVLHVDLPAIVSVLQRSPA